MTGSKFIRVVLVIFLIAVGVYYFSTPHGSDLPLTGIVDGNEVIVSPQITGRIINLTVDEGSNVKKGDLIAELDPAELQASLAAAKANVAMLGESVHEAQNNVSLTNESTGASLNQHESMLPSTRAQLDQAKANLWKDQSVFTRMQTLFDKGEVSAQDRDHADANLRMSQANLKAL